MPLTKSARRSPAQCVVLRSATSFDLPHFFVKRHSKSGTDFQISFDRPRHALMTSACMQCPVGCSSCLSDVRCVQIVFANGSRTADRKNAVGSPTALQRHRKTDTLVGAYTNLADRSPETENRRRAVIDNPRGYRAAAPTRMGPAPRMPAIASRVYYHACTRKAGQ
jgi:hypothetical protein